MWKKIYGTHSVQKLDFNKLPMKEKVFYPNKEVDEIILVILKINFPKTF